MHFLDAQQVQGVHRADRVNNAVHCPHFMEVDLVHRHTVRGGFRFRQGRKNSHALLTH